MNRSSSRRSSLLGLMTRSVVLTLAAAVVPATAYALPGDDVEGPELPPPPPSTSTFTPPANGFDWTVPERFTGRPDGRLDWHYDEASSTYEVGHVRPTSWPVDLDACRTRYDADHPRATQNTYEVTTGAGQRVVGRDCRPRLTFPREGTYETRLRVTSPSGAPLGAWTQDVVVKDLLVVSLGDSIASGEGSPEYPRTRGQELGDWVDDRCHRSSFSGPARAARQLETEDPKTSVTFLSFACSGATIRRQMFADVDGVDPWKINGPAVGSGVLGTYTGIEPPANAKASRIPSQIDQLKSALGVGDGTAPTERRHIDALLLSAGANDAGFGLIGQACVTADFCLDEKYTTRNGTFSGTKLAFRSMVKNDLAAMPASYDALGKALAPENLGLEIGRTFITEYPDPGTEVRPDSGQVEECEEILEDVMWGMRMEVEGRQYLRGWAQENWKDMETELGFARKTFLPSLNARVREAAVRNKWTYVGGISDRFLGHGYCVGDNDRDHPDRWIQTAALSADQQGPGARQHTTGTLHPNVRGQAVYRDRILAEVRGHLAASTPDGGARYRIG